MYKYFVQELWKTNSQNSQPTQVLKWFKNVSPIKLITKYCIQVFAYNSVLPWNCIPQNLMFKLLQKSKYPTEMLYFLAEHTLKLHSL